METLMVCEAKGHLWKEHADPENGTSPSPQGGAPVHDAVPSGDGIVVDPGVVPRLEGQVSTIIGPVSTA